MVMLVYDVDVVFIDDLLYMLVKVCIEVYYFCNNVFFVYG